MAYVSQYPAAYNTTYIKATSVYASPNYDAHHTADPTTVLTGIWDFRAWVAATTSNQRWHIDLGSAKVIKRIYYENGHYSGGYSGSGVQNFTFWGSNDAGAFATLTYGTDTNWTQITTAQATLDKHVASNTADPKYMLVTNSTAYRYYAFKCADNWVTPDGSFLCIRRLELQIDDTPVASGKNMMLLGVG